MGTAMTTVFEADGPSPSMVCRVRNYMAPGLTVMVAAAARLSAARRSPSALVIVARFSRSAAACRDMLGIVHGADAELVVG